MSKTDWKGIFETKFTSTYTPLEIYNYMEKELLEILARPNPNYPRTKEQIFRDCSVGAIAEMYLVDNFGFTRNPKKYHDLISPCGIEVEVKAYRKLSPDIMEKSYDRAKDFNFSRLWLFFQVTELEKEYTYTFYNYKIIK